MIFEWYSGSDQDVAQKISAFYRDYDRYTEKERIDRLRSMIDCEKDSNWLGLLHVLVGQELVGLKNQEDAAVELGLASDSFDPFATNYRDVLGHHCKALHLLINLFDDPEMTLAHGSVIIMHGPDSGLDDYDRATVLDLMGRAATELGSRQPSELFSRLALTYHQQAHRFEPEEPIHLENLLYRYADLGMVQESQQVWRCLNDLGAPAEIIERTGRFLHEHLGSTDEVPS